jgi:Flp pilus assembly protein CpaB
VSQRRTLILIAAIAIGALASFLVWNYVGNIQSEAYNDAERVKVFLVKEEISRGTSGNVAIASIVEESIPRKFKPANAIVSLDDIAGKVARADLVANQVVVADMFVDAGDPEAQVSFADNLTKIQNTDQTTFTMSLDEVRGVAGLVVPGDYVNILVMKFGEVLSGAGGAQATEGEFENTPVVSDFQARYLYQKVQVLAVDYLTVGEAGARGATGDPAAATPADVQKGLITLIVPAAATQILASIPPENIYLSLVAKDYEPVPSGQIDLSPLPSDDPRRVTPYGPEGARSSD